LAARLPNQAICLRVGPNHGNSGDNERPGSLQSIREPANVQISVKKTRWSPFGQSTIYTPVTQPAIQVRGVSPALSKFPNSVSRINRLLAHHGVRLSTLFDRSRVSSQAQIYPERRPPWLANRPCIHGDWWQLGYRVRVMQDVVCIGRYRLYGDAIRSTLIISHVLPDIVLS
jgi:hypothetical protein